MGWESWNFGRSRPTARRRVPLRVSSVHCSVPQALKWDLGLQSHLKCEPSVFFSSQSFSILMQLNHYIPYFDHLFMWGLFSENLKFRKLSNIAIRLQCISNRMTQKNVCCVWHQLSCLDMMNKWDWKRLNWSPVLTPDKRKDWRTGPPKNQGTVPTLMPPYHSETPLQVLIRVPREGERKRERERGEEALSTSSGKKATSHPQMSKISDFDRKRSKSSALNLIFCVI